MGWSTWLVVLVVLVTNVIAVTSALECFVCDTNNNGACGKEFNSDKMPTCSNGGICFQFTNDKRVRRGCAVDAGQTDECTGDDTTTAGQMCYCKTAKCNTGVKSVTSVGPLTALGFVALTALTGRLIAY